MQARMSPQGGQPIAAIHTACAHMYVRQQEIVVVQPYHTAASSNASTSTVSASASASAGAGAGFDLVVAHYARWKRQRSLQSRESVNAFVTTLAVWIMTIARASRVHTTRPAYSATMRSPFLSLLVLCIIVGTSLASTVDVLQVHLAFGGGSDMVVSWGVPNTTDVASYVPAVMYGEDPSALSSTASAPTPEHVR